MKDNIINANIKVKDKTEAFEAWLKLTKALHSLTNEEIRVFALILQKRHELSGKITDEELLNEYLFSQKIKKELEKKLQFDNPTRLPNLISGLRKKGVLLKNTIKPQFIPNLTKDFKDFTLIFRVELND